jgi:hypothetical protein
VKAEQQLLHFAFLDKWNFLDNLYLITNSFMLFLLRFSVGITAVACRFRSSRNVGTQTRERGVLIGVYGRKVPVSIVLLSALNGRVFDGR